MTALYGRRDESFEDLERTAASHFALVLTAAILRIIHKVARPGGGDMDAVRAVFREFPILEEYFAAARDRMPSHLSPADWVEFWESHVGTWERRTRRLLPLRDIGRYSGLGFEASVAAVLVGSVEADLLLGALVASLQGSPGSRRPTVSLLSSITRANGPHLESVPERLVRLGWLRATDEGEVRADQHLRLAPGLWEVVQGRPATFGGTLVPKPRSAPLLKSLPLSPAIRDRALALPALVRRERPTALVVRGPVGSGRKALILAVARALRRPTIALTWPTPDGPGTPVPQGWDGIGPFCELTRIVPVVEVDAAPGATVTIPALPAYSGLIGVVLGRHGGLAGPGVERAIYLDLPYPDPEQRAAFWREGFGGFPAPPPEELGQRLRLTGGYIQRVALQARGLALMAGRTRVDFDDVRRASQALNRHHLEPLAQRVEPWGTWDALFVNEITARDLDELEARCRHRERLVESSGPAFQGSLTRGVRALFDGPTGTGKTLAARILAAELGMDLYRVDLAAVVDKYVGETEKRLDRLLSRAEELDVILLLDEGDALLTGRTDVRSANDRYANLETNFLLQRLESYEGIFVVTTNAGSRIDSAFQRRFDAAVTFPPPGPSERLGIWKIHLPSDHLVDEGALQRLATRTALTGGQIRNAALFATLLSVEDGRGGAVRLDDVERALQREYRKAGASFPRAQTSDEAAQASVTRRVEELLEGLR